MELSIRKKVEIEREFIKVIKKGKTRNQALANVIVETVCLCEDPIEEGMYRYILEAYQMPIEQISRAIKMYDSSSPKLDAVKFVDDLCERYGVDRETIVKRIQNVRRINRYLREKNIGLNPDKQENIKRMLEKHNKNRH